jgi:hypothetical protein
MVQQLRLDVHLYMKDGKRSYYPVVYPNDFWLLKDHMQEINSTIQSLPLHIEVYPTSVYPPWVARLILILVLESPNFLIHG